MQKHPTDHIVIKSGNVDVDIVPVIQWLNKFQAVYTNWSCQGDPGGKQLPYVLFTCQSQIALARILEAVQHVAKVEASWYVQGGAIRYNLRFNSTESLARFIKAKFEARK